MASRIDLSEPLLTATEMVDLCRRVEAGLLAREARLAGTGFADATPDELRALEAEGEGARQRFIRANLRLVAMVAGQSAARSGLGDADLFQEGCLGLIAAVERFDHTRGHTFATYALFWIRAYVNAAVAGQLGASLPSSRAGQLRSARGVESELAQELGRTATVSEVAQVLGRSPSWTASLLGYQQPQSLEGLDRTTFDRLTAGDQLDEVLGHQLRIEDLLAQLDPLGRQVLELRLGLSGGEPCSFAETARRLGITVTRARRLEARALEVLRGICPQQARVHL